MGRIAFYDIEQDKELVLFDSQPELIRGIEHDAKGERIYVSIGDVSCQILDSSDLRVLDNVLVVDDDEIDERSHKAQCEKAFTLLHENVNCVLVINMKDKNNTDQE